MHLPTSANSGPFVEIKINRNHHNDAFWKTAEASPNNCPTLRGLVESGDVIDAVFTTRDEWNTCEVLCSSFPGWRDDNGETALIAR